MKIITCIPFIALLLAIAILPLLDHNFWDKNSNKAIVTAVLTVPIFLFLLYKMPDELLKSIEEYVSFIVMIASLYVITGGILLTGHLKATPSANTLFLLAGSVLANFIGTTGASMLLIRPLLKTNSQRQHIKHIPVFFIFLVANIGGLLTPLGDPPLFMGYLRGVPFSWNLCLLPYWVLVVGLLLIIYYFVDNYFYQKEPNIFIFQTQKQTRSSIRIEGKINFIFLLGVIASIFLQVPAPWRELIMVAMIVFSLLLGKKTLRIENKFTWHPFVEVGILFAGIFITMKPLLLLLETGGSSLMITKAWQYFWITGGLSSFLDNAPTYITFFTLAQGASNGLTNLVAGVSQELLVAISCGAVFMGANTYIGNGPNFMIKSIAEDQGVKMPNFIEYCIYSICILIPVFALLSVLFFR